MALKLITAPTALPVTLAEAKLHLRVTHTDEDTLISALIVSAVAGAEHETGRALMAQTWEVTLDAFPAAIELTRPPVQSVTSITYADVAGQQTVLPIAQYALDAADEFGFAYVVPAYGGEWPETREEINAVKVRFVSGYATADDVPSPIKSWILLQVGAMYAHRESEVQGQLQKLAFVDTLLQRYRIYA